jgi:hypothetical protein
MVILFLISSVQTSCSKDINIVGYWESVEPKAGWGSILEIRADGKMKSMLVARITKTYRVEGNKLITMNQGVASKTNKPEKRPGAAKKRDATGIQSAGAMTVAKQKESKKDAESRIMDEWNEPSIYTVVHKRDRLKLTHDKTGEVLDMRREGKEGGEPGSIGGKWFFKHSTGKKARIAFDAGGMMHYRLVMPSGMTANYRVKGNTIVVTSADDKKKSQSASYKLEKGELVLTYGDKTTRYAHLSGEPD